MIVPSKIKQVFESFVLKLKVKSHCQQDPHILESGGFTDRSETIIFLFPIESYHICHIFSSLARFLVKILEF